MVIIDHDLCRRCGGCVAVCPALALRLENNRVLVSAECTNCGQCQKFCPMEAIRAS